MTKMMLSVRIVDRIVLSIDVSLWVIYIENKKKNWDVFLFFGRVDDENGKR